MSETRPIRPAVGAFAVAVLAIVVFAPGLRNGFAYDDVPIILLDPRIQSFTGLGSVFTRGYWPNEQLALYRPLTTLSFAIDWSLAGNSPAWFHFTNVIINAAAVAAAYLLLARLFGAGAALAGGLLFAVHPVHVEAVTNVVGRAELLSGLFFLACCLVWVRDDRERRGPVVPAALFLLALLSKENAIMLPAALFLVDAAAGRVRNGDVKAWLQQEWRGLAAMVAVAGLYLIVRNAVLGGLTPTRVDPLIEVAATSGQRVLTALQAWPVWMRLLFAPGSLLADYGPGILEPATGLTLGAAIGIGLLAALVTGGIAGIASGRNRTALCLLWFPVTILPVSNLIVPIGVIVAERTLYLPSFAMAAAVSLVASNRLFAAVDARRAGRIVVAAVVVLMAIRSVMRIPDWQSTDTVMQALARDRRDSFRGHWHLARMARAADDVQGAVAQYDTAMAIWPHRKTLVVEAAAYATDRMDLRRALAIATIAVRQWPEDADLQRQLAGIALDAGDLDTADRAIREGLRLLPEDDLLRRMAQALDSIRMTR